MIDSTYAKAYTEVLEIIKFFSEKEYNKIPKEKIEFYKNNMDKDYDFTINPEIDLSEQNISFEANAIIINLFIDYFATEEQKIKIKEILDSNQKIEEQVKREKYDPDNIFKDVTKEKPNAKLSRNNTNTALIKHKESFFTKFKNFIFKMLHINK